MFKCLLITLYIYEALRSLGTQRSTDLAENNNCWESVLDLFWRNLRKTDKFRDRTKLLEMEINCGKAV